MRSGPMPQLVSAEAVMEWECQRDSLESSWCDISGRDHVLAGRLCLLSDGDDCTLSSVEGQDVKGGETNPLSTQDKDTITTRHLRQQTWGITLYSFLHSTAHHVIQKVPVVVAVIYLAFALLLDAWLHPRTETSFWQVFLSARQWINYLNHNSRLWHLGL